MSRLKSFAFAALQLFILNSLPLKAQTDSASIDSLLIKAFATDALLPVLIDSATKNNPEIERINRSEDYSTANLQINKRSIYNFISGVSAYNYGTNVTALNNQITAGSNLTTQQTSYYNFGVGMQLPLGYFINRKNIIKSGQSLIKMVGAEREGMKIIIKQEVIRLYQDFKLTHRLMVITSINIKSSEVNNTMAKKEFVNGNIAIDEVSRVAEIYNKSLIEYESYISRFQTAYMLLEAYTGVDLSNLIKHVK